MVKIVRHRAQRYFLLLSLLMAPAMVLPMGLGLEDGPEAVDAQAEQKRTAQKMIDELRESREPKEKVEPGALYSTLTDHLSPDVAGLVMGYIPLEDTIPNRLLSCKKLVASKITKEQYKLLHVLAEQDKYAHNDMSSMGHFTYRMKAVINYGDGNFFMHDRPLWLRMHYAAIKAWINKERYKSEDAKDLHTFFYRLYPLDLSILARKNNIPVKDLRAALESFDPEIRDYIIKKYNIKTDWLYWSTRPAVLYSAAGVALAGVGAYLDWKYFKK